MKRPLATASAVLAIATIPLAATAFEPAAVAAGSVSVSSTQGPALVGVAAAAEGWLQQHAPARDGGIWFDPRTSCQHLNTVGITAVMKDALLAAVPGASRLCLDPAQYSVSTLDAVGRRLLADRSYWASRGVMIHGFGQATNRDRLVVNVAGFAPADAEALAQRYGGAAVFEDGPAYAKRDIGTDGPPWAAGMDLYQTTATYSIDCTSGYTIYDTNPTTHLRQYYLLTAGHCFPDHSGVLHGAYAVGTVQGNDYFNQSQNDSEIISVPYKEAGPHFYRTDTNRAPAFTAIDHTPEVGGTVCKFGITSGFTCSQIVELHATVYYAEDHTTLINQIISQRNSGYNAEAGDSGSAVWNYPAAGGVHLDGILSGGSIGDDPPGQEMIFSDVDVIDKLWDNAQPVLSSTAITP